MPLSPAQAAAVNRFTHDYNFTRRGSGRMVAVYEELYKDVFEPAVAQLNQYDDEEALTKNVNKLYENLAARVEQRILDRDVWEEVVISPFEQQSFARELKALINKLIEIDEKSKKLDKPSPQSAAANVSASAANWNPHPELYDDDEKDVKDMKQPQPVASAAGNKKINAVGSVAVASANKVDTLNTYLRRYPEFNGLEFQLRVDDRIHMQFAQPNDPRVRQIRTALGAHFETLAKKYQKKDGDYNYTINFPKDVDISRIDAATFDPIKINSDIKQQQVYKSSTAAALSGLGGSAAVTPSPIAVADSSRAAPIDVKVTAPASSEMQRALYIIGKTRNAELVPDRLAELDNIFQIANFSEDEKLALKSAIDKTTISKELKHEMKEQIANNCVRGRMYAALEAIGNVTPATVADVKDKINTIFKNSKPTTPLEVKELWRMVDANETLSAGEKQDVCKHIHDVLIAASRAYHNVSQAVNSAPPRLGR